MTTPSTELQDLFVDLVKTQLPSNSKISLEIVRMTIQHFAEMLPFNQTGIEYWQTLCSTKGIKYSIN